MFKSATVKLTVFYVLAISAVCLAFSVSVYGFASSGIDREAQRQARIFQEFNTNTTAPERPARPGAPQPINQEVRQQIRDQIESDRDQLLINILFVDALIISFGALASYFFAKRTLNPIIKTMEKQRRFSADASHELRTPLTVMKAEIDVALQQKLESDEYREVLVSNLEEIERLRALSDQLLALTNVQEQNSQLESVNISELVGNSVKKFEEKNSVVIAKSIEDNLNVLGQPLLLENYVRIILDNAKKYSTEDDPKISVYLKRAGKNQCVLSIRDEGIGIDRADLEKIFDRFYRSNNAKSSAKPGHGLGLSVASEIAKQHGSRIQVDSVPGQFSEFKLNLRLS